MTIGIRDKQELQRLFRDHGKTFGGREEDYFALLYLTRKFKTTVQEVAHQVAFGGNDYGIDAFYLDRPSFNLYLYQFKWSESHTLFKDSMERLSKDGLDRVFGNPYGDATKNEMLNHLRAELGERPKVDRVFIHMVFLGDLERVEKSQGLSARREDLENKRHLVQQFFGTPETELRVEFISHIRPLPPQHVKDVGTVAITKPSVVEAGDSRRMYVGFVPLMDLYKMFEALGPRFLSRNIRFGLSSDNAPNRKIREALGDIVMKGALDPDVFAFNHNGVALAAEKLSLDGDALTLTVPRLINGAQTVTSTAAFIQANEQNPRFVANRDRLGQVRVLAKIVEHDPNSDFVTNVTICNNRQNPVEPWNLRANDKIQCDLFDKLADEGKVYYSRQENAFSNLSQDELEAMGVDGSRDIRIRPLAQTFLAVQGEVARMSNLSDVFEIQKQYDETFRPSYLEADAKQIVLMYKIHLASPLVMRHLEEGMAEKWLAAAKRARNLVLALLMQAVLNDSKLEALAEDWGKDLTRQWEFHEYLRRLTAGKIKKLLLWLFGHRDYAERLEKEKYDFLRAKETYQRCMDTAARDYGWSKKTL